MAAVNDILDLDAIEADTAPSVTFKLDGREWHCKNRDAMPSLFVDQMLTSTYRGNHGHFWGTVLVADEVEDFVKLISREDSPLNLARMDSLAKVITEAVLNRPTQRPASSASGSRKTGRTSKANSSSAASRRAASAS
jgi:hypothetical protein